MEQRQGDRPRRDADDLLLNGFWKSTRAQNSTSLPSRPLVSTISEATKSTKLQRKSVTDWPPQPAVEEEVEALAKEHLGTQTRETQLKASEPPFRGTVDQQPIILESHISLSDAKELHNKISAELKAEDTSERRFVLVPRDDTHSPIQEDDERPRRAHTDPKSNPIQSDAGNRTSGKLDAVPPFQRRGSRQDLPSLQTEMPTFRRSTSAYAYTPTTKQSSKAAATDSHPSLETASARGQPKGSFDIPAKGSLRQPQGNVSTPVAEKRKSGGPSNSRPATPEKRNSTGSEPYTRTRQDLGEKLTRPQQLSSDSGARRSERISPAPAHLESAEPMHHRKSSSQSGRRHNSSSDEDQNSSDSERRRRRHRNHHHRHNGSASLHPDNDWDRHNRSGSKSTRSSDGKPGSRISSPLASPDVSPSQLPPIDRTENTRNVNYSSTRESKRPISRPVSPLFVQQDSHRLDTLDSVDSGRSGVRSRARSRHSSPVTAPGTRHAASMSTSTLPIPIPSRIDLHSPGDTRHSLSIPQYDDDSRNSRPSTSQKPYWQPPPFQPPSENLDRPVGSFRRFSQDIQEGNIAPLPPCPRTAMTRGFNDWLTLPRSPSFNICPSCFESTIAPTEFHAHFVAAPPKPSGKGVVCDFGSHPWYRIAWLLTRKERRRDLSLISGLAKLAETIPPCKGKEEAIGKWYSILDPETGYPIRNFDVCYSCVKSIETVLPSIRGIFVRTDQSGPPGLARVCDMRFDSKRFVHYFDALETAADSSEDSRYEPDISEFVVLAKRFAFTPECPRDQTLTNSLWYIITQLPEFSVCPECYEEVVQPNLDKGKAIPRMFNKALQRLPSSSCQLYSERMRKVFEKAVSNNDYQLLALKARERRVKELEFKQDAVEAQRAGRTGEVKRVEMEWEKWE